MNYVLYILIKCLNSCKEFEICGVPHVAFIQQIYIDGQDDMIDKVLCCSIVTRPF